MNDFPLSAEQLAEHKAFMAELGKIASDQGYMPPMDVLQGFNGMGAKSPAPSGSTHAVLDIISLHEQGNSFMRAGDHAQARNQYTQALEAVHASGQTCDVLHILFGNRSAAALKLGDAAAAAEDARSCLSVDPGYIKGWFRLASALAALEDKPAMREAAQKGLQLDPANRELMEILKS